MGENRNLWSNMHDDAAAAYAVGSSIPFNSIMSQNPEPTPPCSWSQLLFSGAPGEEKGLRFDHSQAKKLETCWEEQVLNPAMSRVQLVEGIKQEGSCLYGHGGGAEEFQGACSAAAANWSHMVVPAVSSSPRSCFTSLMMTSSSNHNNNNTIPLLDSLSYTKKKADTRKNLLPADHHSSECSTASGGISKKARVQASSSSSQPPLKVRKEKMGDRITALHQLVSPFGKTDTASVLLEAIGYIRFLQGQIEALCFPYFGNSSKNLRNHHFVNGGEKNSVFPEDPGQLLNNDPSLKTNGAPSQENGEEKAKKELRSRGLCLVPMSLSHLLGSDHNNIGPHFWSPTYATGFSL